MSPRAVALAVSAVLLAACAGTPVPPWQSDAKASLDRAVAAYLAGESRVAAAEFERARAAVSSTGRLDLLARTELVQCAAQVASLVFDPCDRFEALRPDAAPAERAYADYLAGRAAAESVALLPAAQRGVAAKAGQGSGAVAALRGIEDPLSRLVGAGVLFRNGHADPTLIGLAIDTASAQGWRRPLLAWLGVQRKRAEDAGDAAGQERLQRQIEVIQRGGAAAK